MTVNETDGAIYEISKSGYYCVALVPVENASGQLGKFGAWVEWRFPYGELPAVDYPKLVVSDPVWQMENIYVYKHSHCRSFSQCLTIIQFYGVFSLIYLIIGLYWAIQTFRYWGDILPVQVCEYTLIPD